MHPHNRSSVRWPLLYPAAVLRMFSKIVWGALGITVIGLVGCAKWNEPVRTDHVSGTIEVDETRLASRYGGRVEKVHAREGDGLKAGQVIVELAAAELKARRPVPPALDSV